MAATNHTMRAKFTSHDVTNARQPDNKETVAEWQAVAYRNGKFHHPVTVRCYMGKSANASVVYACIWVHGDIKRNGEVRHISVSGKGSAGGYGYCKQSAAVDEAIQSAGIKLFGSAYGRHDEKPNYRKQCYINGVGTAAIESAIGAICRALGYRKFTIVR